MKKNRILALLLCAVMVLSMLPVTSIFASSANLTIYFNGNVQSEVTLPKGGHIELSAVNSQSGSAAYQWQISANGVWVDIAGETGLNIRVSYAMIANLLADGKAQLRCEAVTEEETVYSDPVTVTVSDADPSAAVAIPEEADTYTVLPAPEAENVVITPPATEEVSMAVYARNAMPADAGNVTETTEENDPEIPANCVVSINYVFANGDQAANPWTASVASGSSLSATVTSPTVIGYTPDQATVSFNNEIITADTTITVTYNPALVDYTIVHYQQNLNDDNYTEAARETKQGYTESAVGADLAKDYEGFYSLLYDTTTKIAADGSTEVEIYYDRYYYLMTFDLAGGYGVEPIYARYGAPLGEIGTPTKAGYTFNGWSPEFTYTTMPASNTNYTAQWTAGTTTYDVVFWYENADDDHYSQAGVINDVSATAGSTVNGSAYANFNFTGKDADHFTYSHADENVIIKGDGSTVVNVYFTRNIYTIKFVGDVLTCTKVEHEHSHDECCTKTGFHLNCNNNKCPNNGEEHEHGYNCYSYDQTILTVTAKYDSDITSVWTTDPIKAMLDDGYVFKSSITGKYYSFLEKMPEQDITMTSTLWSGNTYTWHYYLEVLPGQDTTGLTTKTDGGITYYEYDSTTVKGSGLSLTYEEDYYPITGFTQRDNSVPSFNNYRIAYLYYTRNSYNLIFSNHGTTVPNKGGTFLYEADISGQNFVPDYPSTLEPNAYVFDGWYTSPFFGDTKFEFTTTAEDGTITKATMPAEDVTLYAKWVPVNHSVKLYLTQADMKANKNQIGETEVVAHGSTATEPSDPSRGEYIFVGWFYMDGDTEKAFDFSMPVNKDLNLYAKWSSNKLMEYTIRYAVEEDGTLIYIAEDTIGSALAGTTKTFEAKTGADLDEGYQSGYFPTTNSHSLTIDIEDPSKNAFTFIYVPKEKLPYTVKYLEFDGDYSYDGTEKILHEEKKAETRDAIITETFVPITGYMPDAYQKRLVLSATENQNVIIFWYAVDTVHAPVQIIHYIQNAEGEGYTIYQESTDLNGVINAAYSTDVLTITGYDYDHATANGTTVTAEAGKVTGTVTESGLLLELYYNREMHPYEFKFLEQGTNKVLADSVTGTARYGSQVTQNAKSIDGYTLVSEDAQAITVQIEEGETASKNVRIFYYKENEVTINYVVDGPEGCGSVNLESETVKVLTGTAVGSTATANDTFRFIGWYDENGNQLSTEATYVPKKVKDKNVAATYYAKFEYNLTTLTVSKEVSGTVYDKYDTFIFQLKDASGQILATFTLQDKQEVIIKDVTVGATYTVTELDTGNRYSGACTKNITINADASKNVIEFTNTANETKWLSATDVVKNVFGSNSEG